MRQLPRCCSRQLTILSFHLTILSVYLRAGTHPRSAPPLPLDPSRYPRAFNPLSDARLHRTYTSIYALYALVAVTPLTTTSAAKLTPTLTTYTLRRYPNRPLDASSILILPANLQQLRMKDLDLHLPCRPLEKGYYYVTTAGIQR